MWVLINKWSLSAHKENAIRPSSSLRQQFVRPTDLPNTHPIKSYIWFSFRSVPWGAHAIILCKSHHFLSQSALFIYLCFPLLLDLTVAFRLSSDSGADDLLPILSFVALRCQCPQLVSECAALEEFIHEGWVIIMEKDAQWPSPLFLRNKQKFVWVGFYSLIPLDMTESLSCCNTPDML